MTDFGLKQRQTDEIMGAALKFKESPGLLQSIGSIACIATACTFPLVAWKRKWRFLFISGVVSGAMTYLGGRIDHIRHNRRMKTARGKIIAIWKGCPDINWVGARKLKVAELTRQLY